MSLNNNSNKERLTMNMKLFHNEKNKYNLSFILNILIIKGFIKLLLKKNTFEAI